MRSFLRRLSTVFLAALILVSPAFAFAVQTSQAETPTRNMIRSERSIRSIIAEKNSDVRSTLFIEFINSRLKYVTVRSLSKLTGSKWLGYVDLVEELDNGEHVAYLLDQGVIQYGCTCLPEGTVSATLTIGDKSETIKYEGETLFSFSNMELDDTAIDDRVSLSVEYYKDHYDIDLFEYYPDDSLDKDDALAAMADAYAEYVSGSDSIQLVDHAVLKLKSYVSNYDTQKRSYIWELYLVHGDELPASATLIRYYPATNTVKVFSRTLRDYF